MKNFAEQQLAILIMAVLVTAGMTAYRYVPILRQKQAVTKMMDAQDAVIEEVCSQSALIPELKQQRAFLSGNLDAFDKRIPETRNFAELWQQIAVVMNECKLTDQLVQPGQELKSDQLCSIPLTIECKGSLEQIFTFFQSLENMNRLIRFEEVRFENDSDFNAFMKLYAKANVYYQKENKDNG
jgi:Tfp pilus assembly protein PilO